MPVSHRSAALTSLTVAVLLLGACASAPRQLMPTPVIYQQPGGERVFAEPREALASTDIDLLFITDRGAETDPESTLPYGQARENRLKFGTARVTIGEDLTWDALDRESRLAERTRELELSLARTQELGRFPAEPYDVVRDAAGNVYRAPEVLREHDQAKRQFEQEVARRIAASPRKEVILYVHGFNETFETAAFTTADLCHFLGRESVCAFFTWPASSTGNFLTSYTTTTESADYAVNHLKKVIRMLARSPGVERLQLLAHSRGTALMLDAARELMLETIAAGQEPSDVLNIDNLVLFSPDIDVDVGAQAITSYVSDPDLISVWPSRRLPRSLSGHLTIYSSPEDRALLVSRILFRSRNRVGNLRAESIKPEIQDYLKRVGRFNIIIYEGERTDAFGHSYFTTNPQVSADVIALLRYGKAPGDPGRELIQKGPVVWEFPEVSR
jgi:esterase/lipase superfamily enzyme